MKKLPLILGLIVLGAILASLGMYFYKDYKKYGEDSVPSFMYTDFGVYVPTEYSIYGIDVSRYQNRINWKEVADMNVQEISIQFAFIKATEGKYMKDKRFKENWAESKKHGITRGAYHYYLPDGNPKTQAKNFMETVELMPGDLPPVIDIEDRGLASHKAFIKDIHIFLDEIGIFCKCKPIVYSYDSFYEDYLEEQVNGYPLWLARYGPKPDKREFHFWQFIDRANVDGIGTKVDMNIFSGDSTAFANLLLR